ncbi:MAG: hypothetical protein HON14_09650 [Rhodospirillaceae bacterium]|mgnify:CR=1 FL=1|jgi:hypothetical protein|nr:hypothetical protein [Rhodospirillaceae bacterium]MBT4589832.1 hypothetical protein [Rhodospirillaceae bacterium]MBT4939384.1 hypothetical protein [Rhodospirillaceae bacterium]MBT5938715.1 hypothetical protein [Rhodospirillaceae bacterium]MBT7266141.1 hypothetical protein [Rhodospirillaceae bacterium]
MAEETTSEIAKFEAPFGRQITLQDVTHESGLQMMRIRIKEGARFTIMDIDPETAAKWGQFLGNWAVEKENT